MMGGGISQLGTGYWINIYGFIPASIFIAGCSVVPLMLTISLKPSRIVGTELSHIETSEEEKQHLKAPSSEQRGLESSKSPNGVSAISMQLLEVFRIYTSNSVHCGICDPQGEKI